MTIEDRLLVINPYSRSGEKQGKIQKIVVHWVGNANTSAIANRNYFNNLATTHKTSASSHYIIGLNGEIIRCIPDNEVAFHSGSYSMNRKSIGIEDCHPDWGGKFNNATYNSLVELCADLCKKYSLGINDIIRHYDVTGKDCPHYYVQNPVEWIDFKNKVAEKIGENTTSNAEPIYEGSDEPVRKYKNGSTKEIIYSDTNLTKVVGSLSPYEVCDCFGIFNNRPMVRYHVDGTNNYKMGFARWTGGVK